MRVGIAGAGRVGSAFTRALASRSRSPVLSGVYARRRRAATALIRRCGVGRAFASPADLIGASDVVILCVPDTALREVAKEMARAAPVQGKIFLHTSGVIGAAPLGVLKRRGARTGTIHPLAAFGPARARSTIDPIPRGIAFTTSGDRITLGSAGRIVASLGGRPLAIPDRGRPAYHLAASIVANHTTILAALAMEILRARANLRGRQTRAAFGALLRTAADRIEQEGPVAGLTGPAARADILTLRRHMSLLRRARGNLPMLYRILSAEGVRIALRRGDLTREKAAAALRLLLRRAQPRRSTSHRRTS